MSTQNWKPTITVDEGMVKMTLPDQQWMEIEPQMARLLAGILMKRADQAEGNPTAHMLMMPAIDD